MMFNCVKALAATDSTHLRQNYLINKLLANYFFSAHSGHVRFSRLTHKPLNSATPNSRLCARPRPRAPSTRQQQQRVRLNWTLALSTSIPCWVEANSRIPTHVFPDSSSSTTSKPPPLRAVHQSDKLKHPSACRLVCRKRKLWISRTRSECRGDECSGWGGCVWTAYLLDIAENQVKNRLLTLD